MFGWLVTDETSEIRNGKKHVTYTWDARTPQDCILDLVDFSQSLQVSLNARFARAVSDAVKHLYQIFDLEKVLKHFCNFDGAKEFKSLFEVVCNLPHVRALADANDTLQLFPHRSDIIFNRLKVTLEKMVWFGLGSCFDLFVDHKGNFVQEFKESN